MLHYRDIPYTLVSQLALGISICTLMLLLACLSDACVYLVLSLCLILRLLAYAYTT